MTKIVKTVKAHQLQQQRIINVKLTNNGTIRSCIANLQCDQMFAIITELSNLQFHIWIPWYWYVSLPTCKWNCIITRIVCEAIWKQHLAENSVITEHYYVSTVYMECNEEFPEKNCHSNQH